MHPHLLVSLNTTLLRSKPNSFCYLLYCLIIYDFLTYTYARFPLYHPRATFVCMESSELEVLECSFSPPCDPLRLLLGSMESPSNLLFTCAKAVVKRWSHHGA